MELINKADKTEGLAVFERPDIQNDLQILMSQSANRPINLVVTAVGLFKDLVIAITAIGSIYYYVGWLFALPLIGSIIHARILINVQEEVWQESLGRSKNSRLMSYITSACLNANTVKELKIWDCISNLGEKYTKFYLTIYESMFKLRLKQVLLPVLPIVIYACSNLLVIYQVINSIKTGALGASILIFIIQVFAYFHVAVNSFSEQLGWLSGHLLYFDKFFNFLDIKEEAIFQNKTFGKKENKVTKGKIEFINVSFRYPGTENLALEDISFVLNPKEKIAIVGKNGCGKSTLIKLLCGFYKPDSGTILIDDTNISSLSPKTLRDKLSCVFQDYSSYPFAIEDNIIMFDQVKKGEENIDKAIKLAGAEFIYRLPNKKDSIIGKQFDGVELSIGQMQKLAIARSIYKDGYIYILDEPTAAIDPLAEKEIFEDFAKITNNKTTIFVTHRLTSIAIADKVMLIEDGKITGFDKHQNLLKTNHGYNNMFKYQFSLMKKLSQNDDEFIFPSI